MKSTVAKKPEVRCETCVHLVTPREKEIRKPVRGAPGIPRPFLSPQYQQRRKPDPPGR